MMSFREQRLRHFAAPMSTAWLLSDIAEAKGKHALFTRQSPQLLKVLREMALIQSTESSNRIEGVTVAADRLRPLVLGHARPRDRSEQDVLGYRRALNEIHTNYAALNINSDTLRSMHRLCQEASGDAGQFKRIDNEIIQLIPGAAPVIRFRCVKATDTAAAVDELCLLYRYALDQEGVHPLVVTAALVLDFLCIHPFRDGNGRVSRLLTLLVLYQHGYEVGRYISLERLIEETKEDYYEVLNRASQGWHQGKHDLIPWLNYFLAIIRRACAEFEERAGQVKAPRGAKSALVQTAVEALSSDFTLADLEHACPGVGRDMIRRLLRELKAQGLIECLGRGPGAKWRKKGNKAK